MIRAGTLFPARDRCGIGSAPSRDEVTPCIMYLKMK